MKLTKNKGMFFAAVFVLIAVYNVIVFLMPFVKGGIFWTAYSFSMLAFFLTAGICYYAFNKEGIKSKVYGVPLITMVLCYLVIQLGLGFLEMIFWTIPFKYGIIVNTILLGACLLGLIVTEAGKEEIVRIDQKIKEKVFYIKSLQVDIECLFDKAPDDTKKALKDVAETVRFSDPMSSPQLSVLEGKIEIKAAALTEAVENADSNAIKALCNELQQLFIERNKKCKLLK